MNQFRDLIGCPSWNWHVVHGSILNIEFGAPRLSIREPMASKNANPDVVRAMRRRRVTPAGQWTLSIETHAWDMRSRYGQVLGLDVDVVGIPSHRETFQDLDGQILVRTEMLGDELILSFDLGGELRVGRAPDITLCKIFRGEDHFATIV